MRWGIIFLVLLAFFAWRYAGDIADYSIESASVSPVIESPRHAGDLTANRSVTQEIDWSRLKPWAAERYADNPVCVAPFMATFGNRPNRGELEVRLELAERQAVTKVNMAKPRDNRFYPICFDSVLLGEVVGQPAVIEILGVDGVQGRSITTWLTVAHGGLPAQIDGAQAEHGLVYDIRVLAHNPREIWGAWVLIGLTALILSLLFSAVLQRGRA